MSNPDSQSLAVALRALAHLQSFASDHASRIATDALETIEILRRTPAPKPDVVEEQRIAVAHHLSQIMYAAETAQYPQLCDLLDLLRHVAQRVGAGL